MGKTMKNTENTSTSVIDSSKKNEVLTVKKVIKKKNEGDSKNDDAIHNTSVSSVSSVNNKKKSVKKVEEAKKLEEAKKVEETKKVEEAKKLEETKKVEEAKKLEEVKMEKKKTEPIIITNTGYDNIDNSDTHDNMSVSTNTRNNMKYIKNEEGLFVCPTCGVTKKNQNTMHYHMKKHMDELPHVCKTCKKSFLQKQTLDLHIASRHPEVAQESENVVQYNGCSFTSFSKGNCKTHMLRIHFAEEIHNIMSKGENGCITCTNCYNDFKSHGSFYYHCIGCLSLSEEDPRLKYLENIM
jgi:hypothetical protein